jgi:hypothetical protein
MLMATTPLESISIDSAERAPEQSHSVRAHKPPQVVDLCTEDTGSGYGAVSDATFGYQNPS